MATSAGPSAAQRASEGERHREADADQRPPCRTASGSDRQALGDERRHRHLDHDGAAEVARSRRAGRRSRNCTGSGWSSPRRRERCATSASVTRSPAMALSGIARQQAHEHEGDDQDEDAASAPSAGSGGARSRSSAWGDPPRAARAPAARKRQGGCGRRPIASLLERGAGEDVVAERDLQEALHALLQHHGIGRLVERQVGPSRRSPASGHIASARLAGSSSCWDASNSALNLGALPARMLRLDVGE